MRTELLALLLFLIPSAGAAAAQPAHEESPRDATAEKLKAIESRYRASLVRMRYRQRVSRSTAEPPEEQELTTTGVVVSPEGLVMVSDLVYEPFDEVPHGVGIRFPASVTRAEAGIAEGRASLFDGSEYPASLVGRDRKADVAFFRIEAPERKFVPVEFGSGNKVGVGDQVAVVTLLPEPLGPDVSVELTRVQALTSRPRPGFVVATGAPDPVGALVVTLEGDVVGYLDALTVPAPDAAPRNPLAFLSVMRDLPKGVGRAFARPASELRGASVDSSEGSPTRRGWLGVEMQALSKELATHMKLPVKSGILLGYVYRNSPAEGAGLRVGDVLVSLEDEPIAVQREDDIGAFAEKILRAGPGSELALGYLRNGERREARARLEPAPRSTREAETLKVSELDLTVCELTYDYLATRFLEPDQQGVVVVQPPVGVSSNQNRIAPGDLLVRVGEEPISDLSHFRELVGRIRTQKPDEVVLFVERGRESFFFAVKPDWN